ncbi:MAG TPA: FtsQ-type POTRA domain-containing protein [Amoebophilaceae bacterium]|nr:FtsQ-type POTRA domain-containing protein [Amoebophilaceae bacterium]
MFKNGPVLRLVSMAVLSIGVATAIWYVTRIYAALSCKCVVIQIESRDDQNFLTSTQLLELIEKSHQAPLVGTALKTIHAYNIKKQLESLPLVKHASVVKTWQGTLTIGVTTKCVLARLLTKQGERFYIDEQGQLVDGQALPLHLLLVVDGIDLYQLQARGGNLNRCYQGLLEVLDYLLLDPFLSRQITSLQVLEDQKLVFGAQIGNHRIEFGSADNRVEKFQKLKLFYKYVIPYKGWDAYHTVNLMFKNQLVCS